MLTYPQKPLNVSKISSEELKKQEKMRDIALLLTQLVEREEVTLKLIIDCLYDVGSVNFTNKKFRIRPVNFLIKSIIKFPKPIFRRIALRWVKKNLPDLLTEWLEKKVSFR